MDSLRRHPYPTVCSSIRRYLAVIFEHQIAQNKSSITLLMAVLLWFLRNAVASYPLLPPVPSVYLAPSCHGIPNVALSAARMKLGYLLWAYFRAPNGKITPKQLSVRFGFSELNLQL